MIESQPLFGRGMRWKVADATTGILAEGETVLAPLRGLQPWPSGRYAETLLREGTRASA